MTNVKLKIKNISQSPYGARTTTGVKMVPPGQVLEDEFEHFEADNIKANKAVFDVGDNVVAETSKGTNGSAKRIAALERENEQLKAHIVELTEKLAVAESGAGKLSLADAVAALDDNNDDHWTDGGKPDLKALAGLTGGSVSRADVDALSPARVRKTD